MQPFLWRFDYNHSPQSFHLNTMVTSVFLISSIASERSRDFQVVKFVSEYNQIASLFCSAIFVSFSSIMFAVVINICSFRQACTVSRVKSTLIHYKWPEVKIYDIEMHAAFCTSRRMNLSGILQVLKLQCQTFSRVVECINNIFTMTLTDILSSSHEKRIEVDRWTPTLHLMMISARNSCIDKQ